MDQILYEPVRDTREPFLTVSAFQIDNLALFTIKDGEELVTSGMATVLQPTERQRILAVDNTRVLCFVDDSEADPSKVGAPAYPGQRRISWHGRVVGVGSEPEPDLAEWENK